MAKLGTLAEIHVPAGYQFTDNEGATIWLELTENPSDPSVLGVITPTDLSFDVRFSYWDIGYVRDDEKDKLDPNAMLEDIRAGTNVANQEQRRRGWPETQVVGWISPPAYDTSSNHLTWAVRGIADGREWANYNTRLLGRGGAMKVKLVCESDQVNALIPTVKRFLTGFTFTSGNKYAEVRAGDKVAKYGLTGLITGGATAVAAKTGLLAKFCKVGAGILAVVAGLWHWLFGKGKKSGTS